MPAPRALASASSSPVQAGPFQNAIGTVVASGRITMDLSQPATVTGGGEVVPTRVSISLDVNGFVSAGQVLWANDQLTPSGTTYQMQVYDSSGNFVADFGAQNISGAAPIDLSLLVPTSSSGSVVSFVSPVLLNPTTNQTINQPSGTELKVNRFEGIRFAENFTDVQAAINDMSSSGGVVYAVDPSVNLALGTLDVGSDTKPITLILGPYAFTADHIVMRANFRIIGTGPINVTNSGTRITSIGANTQPLIVNATSGFIAVYGAGIENMTLIGLSANTSQKGLFFDVSANTTLSVIDHFRLSRVAFSGFKGINMHFKGSINVSTTACFVQFFCLEHVTAVRPSSGAEALRCEGAVGQFDYYSCQFDGNAKGDGNNIYIGGTSNSDVTFPYSHNFFGLTSQSSGTCFTGDGFLDVNFYGSHHENLNGVYLLQSSFTNSRNNQCNFSGGYFANAGINAGNGYILKSTTSNTFGAILEKSSIASVPDKLVIGTNLNTITVRDNTFGANLSSPNVTTGIDAQMNPAATLNLGGYHTVMLQASGTSVTTINSQLGPGEIITFFANGTCQFATGGNITLPGRVSPLVIAAGENATFINSDYSGTNTWRLLEVNTATLTGQSLITAGNGNSVTLLNSQDTLGNLTGNGTDQTVYTYSIPANTIGAGKGLRLTYFDTSNNAVAVTYKVVLGTTTALTLVSAATANNRQLNLEIMNNTGVQNAQVWTERYYEGNAIASSGSVTSAENFANTLTLKITANEANPNTITPKKWFVESIQ